VSDIVVVQIATVITLVLGYLWQWLNARQLRRDQVEDRDRAAKDRELLAQNTTQTEAVREQLEENTKQTGAALEQTVKLASSFSGLSPDERQQAREYAVQQDLMRRAIVAIEEDETSERRHRNVGPPRGTAERRRPRAHGTDGLLETFERIRRRRDEEDAQLARADAAAEAAKEPPS
jgi:hypothetical protein